MSGQIEGQTAIPVLASGSKQERAYLKEHAKDIIARMSVGDDGANTILSRFVRETWCSERHPQLHNVCALSPKVHEYLVLTMSVDSPELEYLAGRDAPESLMMLATKTMHQMVMDSDDAVLAFDKLDEDKHVARSVVLELRSAKDRAIKKARIKASVTSHHTKKP